MGSAFSYLFHDMNTNDTYEKPRTCFFPQMKHPMFVGCVVRYDPVVNYLTYIICASTCADDARNKAGDIVDKKWNETIQKINSTAFSPPFVSAYLYQIEQQPRIRRDTYLATVVENKVFFHDTEMQMNDALVNGATRVHVSISVDTLFDN